MEEKVWLFVRNELAMRDRFFVESTTRSWSLLCDCFEGIVRALSHPIERKHVTPWFLACSPARRIRGLRGGSAL